MSPAAACDGGHGPIPFLPLTYDGSESRASALKLIFAVQPSWAVDEVYVDFVRFTDGITNTLLKAVNRRPGLTKSEIDRAAILLRAYGNGTDVLIDREREAQNHETLMRHGLAPELLARFRNGMLYRFVCGTPARAEDLPEPAILKATARRVAEWHATVPCTTTKSLAALKNNHDQPNGKHGHSRVASIAPEKPQPNVWTTLQKWVLALPTSTEAQQKRQALLQQELDEMVERLSTRPGLGRDGLVFAHADLLCANIIIHRDGPDVTSVSFIDYEYGTPSPAAFDIANHFAEWAGYDCDYTAMPSKAQRREFVEEYIRTYMKLSGADADVDEETRKLLAEVDVFRGVPGFFWGIWALIQSTISDISFDYASYAELRLGEYWACKAEESGEREASGKEMPLREARWAREK